MRSSSTTHKHTSMFIIAVEVLACYPTPYQHLNHYSQRPLPAQPEHPLFSGNRSRHINLYPQVSSEKKKVFNVIIHHAAAGPNTVALIEKERKEREGATKFTFKNCPAPLCQPCTITTLSLDPLDLSKGLALLPWQHAVLCRASSSILYQHPPSVSSCRLIRAEMFQWCSVCVCVC